MSDTQKRDVPSHSMDVITGKAQYRLGRTLGEGGMGTVYLAKVLSPENHPDMPEQVAVKILKDDLRPRSTNYRKEISLMREIVHRNVVRVHDWNFSEDPKFAVFDYHLGGSVADQLFQIGPMPPGPAWSLLVDILSALVATHRHGILHLDIKPGNILIGEDGRFLLSDFGVATGLFVDGGRRIVGSPAYMSPEQARGETGSIDTRSDLFCLGTTMWHLITGRLPLIRPTAGQVLALRSTEPLPRLVDEVGEDYRPLADIVDRLLAFHPRSRPGSAAEILKYMDELTATRTKNLQKSERGRRVDSDARLLLREQLSDPVLLDLLRRWGKHYRLRTFNNGETICLEGEKSFDVYVLLEGCVEIVRNDRVLDVEAREGAIMGEVAALIGSPRTAKLQAQGRATLALLNAAELEQAAKAMPALAVRIMKTLASRLEQAVNENQQSWQ